MTRKLGLCHACKSIGISVAAKYRCPACEALSCSLPCVRKHKTETNCTGVRNRAALVRKVDYTDTHLMSDFTLLEDTTRALDSAFRDHNAPPRNGKSLALVPGISKGRMSMLTKEAAKRNINLRFMPRGFARHARNSSHVKSIPEPDPATQPALPRDKREKAMFWHLDLYFASCSDKSPGTKLVKVDACEEEQAIRAILEGATGALKKGKKRRRSDLITCPSKANDGYVRYLHANPDDLVVFLRNEHVASAGNFGSPPISARTISKPEEFDICRYVPIPNDQTLKQVLEGRSVVEFPVLHVAFKDSAQAQELKSATCGIFEKPDDSSDSGDSSSESDSESEDERTSEAAEPDPPACEPPRGENGKADGSLPDTGAKTQGPRADETKESLLKYRRIESPPSIATRNRPERGDKGRELEGKLTLPKSAGDFSKEEPNSRDHVAPRHGAIVKTFKGEAETCDRGEKATRATTDKSSISSLQQDGRQELIHLDKPGISESGGSSVATGRRPADTHVGTAQPDKQYMESVKAILETRIPRKKSKPDQTAPASTQRDGQSATTKLVAPG